jgi:hypothetical protein
VSASIALAALLLGAPIDRGEPKQPAPDLSLRAPPPTTMGTSTASFSR